MVLNREVFIRVTLVIMAIVMLSTTLMVKPSPGQPVSGQLAEIHQHEAKEPPAEHSMLFHAHGSVHHLNADHSHDINKLFTLGSLNVWLGKTVTQSGEESGPLPFTPSSTPERPPRSWLA